MNKMLTGRVLILIGLAISAQAFTKYGRTCKDIGCLPSQVCTMVQDSCSYSQRDGKDCGTYPTCMKNTNAGSSGSGASLNPAPDNTRVNQPSNYPNNNPPPVDPNQIFGQPPSGNTQQNTWHQYPVFPNPNQRDPLPQHPYPQIPQSHPPQPQYPYAQPQPFPQTPFAFGNPSPQRNYNPYNPNPYNPNPYNPTTKPPSLLDQFLYNKQGGRRNASSQLTPSIFCIVLITIVLQIHNRIA